MSQGSSADLSRALVRFNSHVLALAAALFGGLAVAVATLVLLVQGGDDVGTMLATLGVFFPGYRVSVGGALVGALWAGLVAYGLTVVFARLFGSWTLRGLRERLDSDAPPEAVRAVAALPPVALAVATGFVLALALFVAHHWVHLRLDAPGDPARYLALLANYLPGYSVDFTGSFVGAFWLFAYGFIGAAAVAWIYNGVVALRARSRA